MWWSGSRPLSVVRASMWGFLLVASAAWLVIAWSVLRLDPTDIVRVAGPVLLFGALTEAVRALAGTRMWWLNAGMAVLFAATGALVLLDRDSSYATPAALVGWYLMVRGAADIAVSMMTRESDRIWGLLMVVGVLETGLGFFATSPLARTADVMVVSLGGLALARGVSDLVAALRLREAGPVRAAALDQPPERAAAGYAAGMADYAAGVVPASPRHRAAPRHPAAEASGLGSVAGGLVLSTAGRAAPWRPTPSGARSAPSVSHSSTAGEAGRIASGPAVGASSRAAGSGSVGAAAVADGEGVGAGRRAETSHDEVLWTTADMDAMLALAGVTGAAVGVLVPHHVPKVPDTPEGLERLRPGGGTEAAEQRETGSAGAANGSRRQN